MARVKVRTETDKERCLLKILIIFVNSSLIQMKKRVKMKLKKLMLKIKLKLEILVMKKAMEMVENLEQKAEMKMVNSFLVVDREAEMDGRQLELHKMTQRNISKVQGIPKLETLSQRKFSLSRF